MSVGDRAGGDGQVCVEGGGCRVLGGEGAGGLSEDDAHLPVTTCRGWGGRTWLCLQIF